MPRGSATAALLEPAGLVAFYGAHRCFNGPHAQRLDNGGVLAHPTYREACWHQEAPRWGTYIRRRVGMRQHPLAELLNAFAQDHWKVSRNAHRHARRYDQARRRARSSTGRPGTVDHDLEVFPDPAAVAARAADYIAGLARTAVAAGSRFSFAVSGGQTPWAMFRALAAAADMPWASAELFQVDERVAPAGDPDRNLTHLRESLGSAAATLHPMPVEEEDLAAAARGYAAALPARFDLVHLGLGPDGHTASLVPGDPVLDETSALVAVTLPYQGHRRMTLTYTALARAARILWLVTGADKQQPLGRLLSGDRSIPAGRVGAGHSLVMADAQAAERMRGVAPAHPDGDQG
jgi:6-phosphogluconolactonase